jgi:predicted RNA-binding Zn-ribbon protein involved in translation (DUF1610 family)
MSGESALAIFRVFPEIERLGRPTLQRLCDSWLSTPIAKEFAVSSLDVDEKLLLRFQCQLTHKVIEGEAYYFPIDRLLFFIADNGISDVAEREAVKRRITAARGHAGPDEFSRFKINPGPKRSLFLTCPHCGDVMQTQYMAYRSQPIRFDREEIECPECHRVYTTDGSELHFEPS